MVDEDENEEPEPLREALAYPFAGEGATTRMLVGAGLHFLAGVVLAAAVAVGGILVETDVLVPVGLAVALGVLLAYVPAAGYGIAAVRALLEGEEAPPGFDDWTAIARDGLWAVGVAAAFALPLVALGALALAGESVAGGAAGTALAVVATVLAVVYGLLAAYALPAALVNATHEGSARAALPDGPIRQALGERAYFRSWVAAVAVLLAGAVVGGPLIAVVVGFAVLFVAQVAAVNLLTRGVIDALDITTGAEPPPPPASGYVPGWGEDDRERGRRRQLSGGVGDALLPTTGEGDGGDLDRADDASPGEAGRPAAAGGSRTAAATADDPVTDLDRAERASDRDSDPARDATAGDPDRTGDGPGTAIAPTDEDDEGDIERRGG